MFIAAAPDPPLSVDEISCECEVLELAVRVVEVEAVATRRRSFDP